MRTVRSSDQLIYHLFLLLETMPGEWLFILEFCQSFQMASVLVSSTWSFLPFPQANCEITLHGYLVLGRDSLQVTSGSRWGTFSQHQKCGKPLQADVLCIWLAASMCYRFTSGVMLLMNVFNVDDSVPNIVPSPVTSDCICDLWFCNNYWLLLMPCILFIYRF